MSQSTLQAKGRDITPYQSIPQRLLPDNFRQTLQQNIDRQLAIIKIKVEDEQAVNKTCNVSLSNQQQRYDILKSITSNDLDNVFAYLNGLVPKNNLDLDNNELDIFDKNELSLALYQDSLQQLPECNLWHVLRAYYLEKPKYVNKDLSSLLEQELYCRVDLRLLADVLQSITGSTTIKDKIAGAFLFYFSLPFLEKYILNQEHLIWPFFAENLHYIDQALGLFGETNLECYKTANALAILSLFPQLPKPYIPLLQEWALGAGRRFRLQSQLILNKIPNIHLEVEKALLSTKQDIRIVASDWLAKLGGDSSIKSLKRALSIEKKEAVIASILSALSQLGEDISYYLSPDYLLNEAKKGLKTKKPVSLDWLEPYMLPELMWQNGQKVAVEIIYWWIILAVKLKQTTDNGLFDFYLKLLDVKSQQKLGYFVVQMFIIQDTELTSDKYSRYVRSALNTKGMLALCKYSEPYQIADIVRPYLKFHSSKRSEISAVFEAIVTINHAVITQLVYSTSLRYSSNIVRKNAKKILEEFAQAQACSLEQLIERMVPTANLNERGVLDFDYGDRKFTAQLDHCLQLVIKNEAGKILKSLPEATNSENVEQIKAYKKLLTSSKTELKQVINNQTKRLYDMMSIGQVWSYQDWFANLYQHPIMNRMIESLIWLEVDNNNTVINSFRPTEDGCLININDDEVTLNPEHYIKLAHSVYLSDDQVEGWLNHLKDYKVTPLFTQFANHLPDLSQVIDNKLNDYYGKVIKLNTLKNILYSKGYHSITDWDCIDGFAKLYSSLGIRARIMVSQFYRTTTNSDETVKLYDLYFTQQIGTIEKTIPLDRVPQIILAESYADYCLVAKTK